MGAQRGKQHGRSESGRYTRWRPQTAAPEPNDRATFGTLQGTARARWLWMADKSITALLRKSAEGRSIPSPGQTYPARFVIGVPRVVKRFRIAALI